LLLRPESDEFPRELLLDFREAPESARGLAVSRPRTPRLLLLSTLPRLDLGDLEFRRLRTLPREDLSLSLPSLLLVLNFRLPRAVLGLSEDRLLRLRAKLFLRIGLLRSFVGLGLLRPFVGLGLLLPFVGL
jgi:hypothetical protein